MKIFYFALLCTLQFLSAQIQHDWSHTYGDSSTALMIHDFFVENDGTVFVVGQKFPEGKRIFYISAVSKNSGRLFEINIEGKSEENGLLVAPFDEMHVVAAGYFEDTTGTFNFRTLKLKKSGEIIWNKEFGDDGLGIMDVPSDIETDPFGNIVVAGSSHSLEGQYGLAHYSSTGKENWSVRHTPFSDGWFRLNDIVIDTAGNIYGITSNTFVNDTTHGTIFKRDMNGNVVWERTFDLYFSEEAVDQLLLRNDTLYVTGSLVTEGSVNSTIVCLAVTSSGNVAAYKRFELPGTPIQQMVRDLKFVFNEKLALVNESFLNGKYILHTFVMTKDFSIVYSDSLSDSSALSAQVRSLNSSEFEVYTFGGLLHRKRYRQEQSSITVTDSNIFDVSNYVVDQIYLSNNSLYTNYINLHADKATSILRIYTPPIVNSVKRSTPLLPQWILYPAFPNPFNPSTTITYEIPVSGNVTISLYDLGGKFIQPVYSGYNSTGTHSKIINGNALASGTYFVRMIFQNRSIIQRIVFVK